MGYGGVNLVGPPRAFWSPDDGWQFGRLCIYCEQDCGRSQPQEADYYIAVFADAHGMSEAEAIAALRHELPDDDQIIDALYG